MIKNIFYRLRGQVSTSTLVKKGLKVGKNFNRMADVIIDDSHCFLIEIGNNVTLAPRVHILAHDASTKLYLGYTKIGKVKICDNVFIGANSIILPGVEISSNVIVGCGSVVTKSLDGNFVYAGNPCKKIDTLENYLNKHRDKMKKSAVFNDDYLIANLNDEKIIEMNKKIGKGGGYIV